MRPSNLEAHQSPCWLQENGKRTHEKWCNLGSSVRFLSNHPLSIFWPAFLSHPACHLQSTCVQPRLTGTKMGTSVCYAAHDGWRNILCRNTDNVWVSLKETDSNIFERQALWRRSQRHLIALREKAAFFKLLSWMSEQAAWPTTLGTIVALLLLKAGTHTHFLFGVNNVGLWAISSEVATACAEVLNANAAATRHPSHSKRNRSAGVDGGSETFGRSCHLCSLFWQNVKAQCCGSGHALFGD
mmetsp:Transcript_17954/g.35085  ORF Transcript_17954/g.35085 Transcript_17954/m.35085 type:complete len:242 (-) Transcript_17954:615-1340(-)